MPGAEDPQAVPAVRLHQPADLYFLGDRSLASFEAFVFPDLAGVVVYDYDKFPGISHQLCAAHLLRDIEDAAPSYPGRSGPARPPMPCALSSTPRTWPATRARPQSTPMPPRSTCGSSGTASGRTCPPYAGSPARTWRSRPPPVAGMPARPRGRRAPVPL